MNGAVILAAGKGERMGNMDKVFMNLGPYPVVAYSLRAFEACPDIDAIVVVTRQDRIETVQHLINSLAISKAIAVTVGGTRRQDSVALGLERLPCDIKTAVIHDAARPLVTPELISLCVKSALSKGSGVAAKKVVDTIKEADENGLVVRTVDRNRLYAVETPQAFKASMLREALAEVEKANANITDDASAVEFAGKEVHLVEWDKPNLKLTHASDERLLLALLD